MSQEIKPPEDIETKKEITEEEKNKKTQDLPSKALSSMFDENKNKEEKQSDYLKDGLQKHEVSGLLLINTEKQNSKLIKKMKKGFSFSPDSEAKKLYHYKNSKNVIDISKDLDSPWAKILKMICDGQHDETIECTDYFDFIENFFDDSDLKDTKVHNLVKLLMDKEFIENLDLEKLQDDFFNRKLSRATEEQVFKSSHIDETDTLTKSTATTVVVNDKLKKEIEDNENDKYSNALTSNSEADELDKDQGFVDINGKLKKFSTLSASERREYQRQTKARLEKEHREKMTQMNDVVLSNTTKLNNDKIDPTEEKEKNRKENEKQENRKENEKSGKKKKTTYVPAQIDYCLTDRGKTAVNMLTVADTTKDEIDSMKKKPDVIVNAVVNDTSVYTKTNSNMSLLDVDPDQINEINEWKYVKPQALTKSKRSKAKSNTIAKLSEQFRKATSSGTILDPNEFRKSLNNESQQAREHQEIVDLLTAPNSLSLTGFPELLQEARQVLHQNDAPGFEKWKKFKITDTDNKTFIDYIESKSNESRTSQRIENAKSLCSIMSKAPYHPYVDDTMGYTKIHYYLKELCNDDHSRSKVSFVIENPKDELNKKVQLLWSYRHGCRTGLEPESDILPCLEASIYLIPYHKIEGAQNLATTKFPEKIPVMIMNNYLAHLLTGNFSQTMVVLAPYREKCVAPYAFRAYNIFIPEDIESMEKTHFKALCLQAGQAVKKHLSSDQKVDPNNMLSFQNMFFKFCDDLREQLGSDVGILKSVGIASNQMRLKMHKASTNISGESNIKIVTMLRDNIAKVLPGDNAADKQFKADKLMPNFIRLTYKQKLEFVNCVMNCIRSKHLGNTFYNNCIIDVNHAKKEYKTRCCKKNETIESSELYLSHPCIYHMLADGSGRHKLRDNASEIPTCNSCQTRYKSVIISSLCHLAGLFEKSLKQEHYNAKVKKTHVACKQILAEAQSSDDE